MTHLTIAQAPRSVSPFDGIKRTDERGDYWSAREMQPLLGYDQWRRFEDSIERARATITNSGMTAADHVADAGNMVEIGSGATRVVSDYRLTRYGAYIVAMNGDPRKPEVAAAQTYFAVRTHEAEVADVRSIPQDYPSALRALAAEVEAKTALEAKVAADAPKVGYVDRYVADGDLLRLRTVAARVGIGEGALRELLIARKWIYVETSTRWSNSKGEKEITNRYSAYSDFKPYFQPVPRHEAPRFKGEVMHTLKVTPAGAEAIARLVQRAGVSA